MTLNVPANTTLTIAAAQTNDVTINVAKGATLKVPNGTLVGANGAFTAAGDVTVNTASGKTQISSAADLTLNSNVSLQNGDKNYADRFCEASCQTGRYYTPHC